MAASAGSPAGRRSSSLSWRRSRPRSVRRTQNSGCGGKKGRSTRLHGPRADPQRDSAPGPPVLRPAWHPPGELVPLEERRKNASRVLAGSRRRCPGASCRQLRRNLRRLGAPQALGPPSGRRLPGLDVLGGACPGQAWAPPAPALPRRQLARARRAVFLEPPTRRCRVWQSDFSEFETIGGGIWRLCGVVDYVAKVSLACPATTTQTAVDAIAALEAARMNADTWLGHSLLEECLHPETGEVLPIAIVTDNGAAFRSAAFARYIASRPEFTHVRTRHRSPQTNGVIERFFQALKYEYLYRNEIGDGATLAAAVDCHQTVYNDVRPHEAIAFRTPLSAWRDFDCPTSSNLFTPETVSLS